MRKCAVKKKIELKSGLLSHCGAVTKGLTNCAPQVKEQSSPHCSLVLQLVLIAVAWMPFALCFICFFAGIEFCIPRDCVLLHTCWMMKLPSLVTQSLTL